MSRFVRVFKSCFVRRTLHVDSVCVPLLVDVVVIEFGDFAASRSLVRIDMTHTNSLERHEGWRSVVQSIRSVIRSHFCCMDADLVETL